MKYRKLRFIVEVEASPGNAILSNRPASPEEIARTIHRHIVEGSGYYPNFNYNTVKVIPVSQEKNRFPLK